MSKEITPESMAFHLTYSQNADIVQNAEKMREIFPHLSREEACTAILQASIQHIMGALAAVKIVNHPEKNWNWKDGVNEEIKKAFNEITPFVEKKLEELRSKNKPQS